MPIMLDDDLQVFVARVRSSLEHIIARWRRTAHDASARRRALDELRDRAKDFVKNVLQKF